jgi:hypothetical protein
VVRADERRGFVKSVVLKRFGSKTDKKMENEIAMRVAKTIAGGVCLAIVAGIVLMSSRKENAMTNPEHAVIVNFNYGSNDLTRLFEIEERLESAITEAGVGEFDGNDIATDGSDANLYMYGPNADAIFEVIRPILEKIDCMKGAKATLRYGPPDEDVPEKVIKIDN